MKFDDESRFGEANHSFRALDEDGNKVTAQVSEEAFEDYGREVCLSVAKALYSGGEFSEERGYRLVKVHRDHVIAYDQRISFQKRS